MKITRKQLKQLIKEEMTRINEVPEVIIADPERAKEVAASAIDNDISLDPHDFLAIMSVLDPTMTSDMLDAALYAAEGDPESAALVLLFAGGGVLGAGALVVKAKKMSDALRKAGVSASKAAKAADDVIAAGKNLDITGKTRPPTKIPKGKKPLGKVEIDLPKWTDFISKWLISPGIRDVMGKIGLKIGLKTGAKNPAKVASKVITTMITLYTGLRVWALYHGKKGQWQGAKDVHRRAKKTLGISDDESEAMKIVEKTLEENIDKTNQDAVEETLNVMFERWEGMDPDDAAIEAEQTIRRIEEIIKHK